MKPQKPLTAGPVGQAQAAGNPEDNGNTPQAGSAAEAGSGERAPLRLMPMHNDIQPRPRRGRLGRDVQTKLGKTLQAYFDDVVKEGVPDRFKELLEQFDRRTDESKGRTDESKGSQ